MEEVPLRLMHSCTRQSCALSFSCSLRVPSPALLSFFLSFYLAFSSFSVCNTHSRRTHRPVSSLSLLSFFIHRRLWQ